MRKFRVAHVITRLCKGGAQENTFHTVRLADRTRFDVDLISGPTTGSEGSIEPQVVEGGVSIIREPDMVREPSPRRDWIALNRLKRRFKQNRYDIVHTHTSKAGFLGRVAAWQAGVPIIVHTPHGHIFHGYFSRPTTWFYVQLERWAARVTDRIIALTTRGIEEHLEQGIGRREQYVAIFSGIDLGPFEAAGVRRAETRERLGVPADALLIGGVGRLEPVKGFAYFVEAAHAVADALPDAHFLLAGDGSRRGELVEKSRPLGNRFRVLGLRDDVPDLMAALDVFVLPSVNEGMGRVLLEAGAAGIPCVATAVGGVPSIVRDGVTGLLAPPGDSGALARAVLELAGDPERRRRLGQAARDAVVPEYGLERMVERIEALYDALIKEKGLDA